MALDKPSSPSASPLAVTIATGLVGVFAAFAANAHGTGGGSHGGAARSGGASPHSGIAMGHAQARGSNFRGNYGARYGRGYGFRGPRVFIGGGAYLYGAPYYYDYGPSYYVAPPVVPRTYIVESAPQQRHALPAPSEKTICSDGWYSYVCIDPDGTKHEFVKPKTTNTAAPPKPPEAEKAPPKSTAPAACTISVIQVRAFNDSSSMEKQFPESIPANCYARITWVSSSNALPATGIDMVTTTVKGFTRKDITISYNGKPAEVHDNLLKGCPRDVFNVGMFASSSALLPSADELEKLFRKAPDKCRPDIHDDFSPIVTPANGKISVTLQQLPGGRLRDIVDTRQAHQAVQAATPVAPAVAPAQASAGTPVVIAQTTITPNRVDASLAANNPPSPAKTGWFSWWPPFGGSSAAAKAQSHVQHPLKDNEKKKTPSSDGLGTGSKVAIGGGILAAVVLAALAIRGRRPPNGWDSGGRRPTPRWGEDDAVEGGGDAGSAASGGETANQLNGAEANGILKAFRENRGEPANEIKFELNKNQDAMLVSTKDADVEVRRDGSKATLKTGAVTFSDETIKGMLEERYNSNGGASKQGKHRIMVNCSDEVFARVVHFANTAEGRPFEIVRKPARPADSSPKPAANDANYRLAA